MPGRVNAVSSSSKHSFSKPNRASITLITGMGVQEDAHCGTKVKHRSRVAQDPKQPNLRQVHLIHGELFDELAAKGFTVRPGQLGENITTEGIDLLVLPAGTELRIGAEVILCLTGLRNPCVQLDQFQPGLMLAVLDRSAEGKLVRKAGVMSIVLAGGLVCPGDEVCAKLPAEPYRELERV